MTELTAKPSPRPTTRRSAASAARPRRRPPASTTLVGVLAVLVVAMGAASAYFLLATRQQADAQAQRQRVLTAARAEAVNLTSQDYATIDRDLDRMIGGTTGDLRSDLDKQRSRYRDTFVKNKLRARSSATEAGLVTIRGRAATVLVVVDQVVHSDTNDSQPQPRHYRLELDMSHVDGRWLASGLRAAGLVS